MYLAFHKVIEFLHSTDKICKIPQRLNFAAQNYKDDDDDDDDYELFLWDDLPTISRSSYFQKVASSGSLTIVTSQHAEVKIDPGRRNGNP